MGGICVRINDSPIIPEVKNNKNKIITGFNCEKSKKDILNRFFLSDFTEKNFDICFRNKKSIKMINTENIHYDSIHINKLIDKGTYNNIYDISCENGTFNDCIISSYINSIKKINKKLDKDDFINFFTQCEIQTILADEYDFVPKIKKSFITENSGNIHIWRIMEKLDVLFTDYFKTNNEISCWLNLLIQISYKLIIYQKKYKFNHSDFKYTNIMGGKCKKENLLYEITLETGENISINFNTNGIDWKFIDFGFSIIDHDNQQYQSYEFYQNKIIFKSDRDLNLFCYSVLLFIKDMPDEIKKFLIYSLKNNNNFCNIENQILLPIDEKKEIFLTAYHIFNENEYNNINCYPINFFNNIKLFFNK